MATTKMCSRCRLSQKAKGKQRCIECLLLDAAPHERERAADQRLAMIPTPLRRARVPESAWPPGRRWCAGCQSFPRRQDCIGARCSACAGRASHADMLARTYTINGRPFTADDYDALFRAQGGVCPICLRPSHSKRMAVDHDHVTGEVRGLLDPGDWGCNLGILGRIKDLDMARRVVAYLEDPPAKRIITD